MSISPTRIGDFDVLRQIGSGGMGDVYLGLDPRLDRQVAIKVVRGEVRDQDALDRFFREARASAALRHPNIVTIYASGQHERQPYMVMEYVDGESLSEVIRQRRNLMLSDKLSYLEQICAGLHYAHRAGIVHRDVKPANLMIDRQGVVRILDFGIARIEGSAMTLDGTMVGSLNYMSPEQMLGKSVDHRSDMFSLGSVAYELLSYHQAFSGGMNDGLLQRLPNENPPALRTLRTDIPPTLEAAITRALEKDPAKRYADLEEMREAILAIKRDLGQDDVRTIVVRPRGRASDTPGQQPMAPGQHPMMGRRRTDALPPPGAWSDRDDDTPDAQEGEPAWAAALPTRVVRPKVALAPLADTLAPTPAPGSSSRPPSTVTTRTRAVTTRTVRPRAERTSAGRGILVGSILGTGLIAALTAFSWTPGHPPSPLEREGSAINMALGQYRAAYRTRDMAAMTQVFPDIPRQVEQEMQRTFSRCLVYEVIYDGVRVEIDPVDETAATADVRSSHVCTPKSGGREVTTDQHDLLSLRKQGDTWLIERSKKISGAPATGEP